MEANNEHKLGHSRKDDEVQGVSDEEEAEQGDEEEEEEQPRQQGTPFTLSCSLVLLPSYLLTFSYSLLLSLYSLSLSPTLSCSLLLSLALSCSLLLSLALSCSLLLSLALSCSLLLSLVLSYSLLLFFSLTLLLSYYLFLLLSLTLFRSLRTTHAPLCADSHSSCFLSTGSASGRSLHLQTVARTSCYTDPFLTSLDPV